jgi:cell division protein FtsX
MENLTMNTALFSSLSLSLAFALFGMAKTANAQTSEQLEEDTKKLVTMYIHLSDEWSGKYDRRGLKIDDYMKLLKEVQSINDMAVVPAEKALADFKKKYHSCPTK